MASPYELLCQAGDDALRATIKLRRHTFSKWGDLRNPHWSSSFPSGRNGSGYRGLALLVTRIPGLGPDGHSHGAWSGEIATNPMRANRAEASR